MVEYKNEVDVAQRQNVVNQVLNQVGGQCFKPIGTATTANGLCANASQTMGNMAETLKVADALAKQAPANEPNFSGAAAGPSVGNTVLGAVATAVVTAVNPMAGALLGAGTALHAGLQSLKPSNQYYNLAQAPLSEAANAQSYTDIMGDTYTPAGQQLRQAPVNGGKMSEIGMAAQKVSSTNSPEDIKNDLLAKFREQMAVIGSTELALKQRHGLDLAANDPNYIAELKTPELVQQRARPSINIMGGPSFG
jgi:hypothetical protein